ncbi:MAG: hypothetical protein K0B37_09260 [Bacteroidales bacterium]|nr:hypothetical protein [Bacteroidales bacterium]
MSKNLLFVFLLLITTGILAQDCDLYFPLVENKGVQYQNFNRRERLESTQDVMVKKVTLHSDHTEALLSTRYYDNRERLQHETEFTVRCKGNELVLDVQSLIDPAMLDGFKDMEINVSSIDIVIPDHLKIGDNLPDAGMTMSVSAAGMRITEIEINITDRKVEAIESITTPAGTFECFKITYATHTQSRTMGMTNRLASSSVEYYAPGVGNVRTEIYDKNQRLESYTVLSKIY